MKKFKGLFIFELKRFISKKNLLIMVLFSIVSLFFLHLNIQDYQRWSHANPAAGRFKAVPPAVSVFFFDSGVTRRMTASYSRENLIATLLERNGSVSFPLGRRAATFPVGDRAGAFEIYSCEDRGNPYREGGWYTDYAGTLFFIGSLLLMCYGAGTFKHLNFLRMCSRHLSLFRLQFCLILSRYLVSLFLFGALSILAAIVVWIHGAGDGFTAKDYLQVLRFVFLWVLISLFFLVLGALLGLFRKRHIVYTTVVALWLFQVIVFPRIVNCFAYVNQDIITQSESSGEGYRAAGFSGGNRAAIKGLDSWQRLALLTPSSTYKMMTQEMSNQGYADRFSFNRFLESRSRASTGLLTSFDIAGVQQRIYRSESLMPAHYLRGMLIIFLYVFFTMLITWYRLHRLFYKPLSRVVKEMAIETIAAGKEAFEVFKINDARVIDLCFAYLSKQGEDFFFICAPGDLPPDVNVNHVLQLFVSFSADKSFGYTVGQIEPEPRALVSELDDLQVSGLLQTLARSSCARLYVFYDTVKGMAPEATKQFRNLPRTLPLCRESGIVYLTTDDRVHSENRVDNQAIVKNRIWTRMVDMMREKPGSEAKREEKKEEKKEEKEENKK